MRAKNRNSRVKGARGFPALKALVQKNIEITSCHGCIHAIHAERLHSGKWKNTIGKRHDLGAKPSAHKHQRQSHSHEFDGKGEGLFLNLRGRLKNGDQNTKKHTDQDRGAERIRISSSP